MVLKHELTLYESNIDINGIISTDKMIPLEFPEFRYLINLQSMRSCDKPLALK